MNNINNELTLTTNPLQQVLDKYEINSSQKFFDNLEAQRAYFIEILRHIRFVAFNRKFMNHFLNNGRIPDETEITMLIMKDGKYHPISLTDKQFYNIYSLYSNIINSLKKLLDENEEYIKLIDEKLFTNPIYYSSESDLVIKNIELLRFVNDPDMQKAYFHKDKVEDFHSKRFAIIPWINQEYKDISPARINNNLSDREKDLVKQISTEIDRGTSNEFVTELCVCLLWSIYEGFIKDEHYKRMVMASDMWKVYNFKGSFMNTSFSVSWEEILMDTIHFATQNFFNEYYQQINDIIESLPLSNKNFDFYNFFLRFERSYQEKQFGVKFRPSDVFLKTSIPFHFLFRDILTLSRNDIIQNKELSLPDFYSTFSILLGNTKMFYIYEGQHIFNGYLIIYDYIDKEENHYHLINLKCDINKFDYDRTGFFWGFVNQIKTKLGLENLYTGKCGITLDKDRFPDKEEADKKKFNEKNFFMRRQEDKTTIFPLQEPQAELLQKFSKIANGSTSGKKKSPESEYYFPWGSRKITGKQLFLLHRRETLFRESERSS